MEFCSEVFSHEFEDETKKKKESFGIIVTSSRRFRNVLYADDGQFSDGVLVAVDGTYRLHYGTGFSIVIYDPINTNFAIAIPFLGNWTLVAVRTYWTRYIKRKYSICCRRCD
ncbi:hypothetical protein JG688_00002170 [Phytophthora aleatoria]|uniref:Uncharacterized protein n=1 Tax=Phytophthora aleatoria TaxID=2496075 RepID=A0A8J5J3C2_9STRA|nr:hypothetical protein JG688_00002170 [Phytophthora aleatoria]